MAYASSFRFQWNGHSVAAQLQAAIEAGMEDTAQAAVSVARDHARVKTGAMRDSIEGDVAAVPNGYQLTLAIGVPYGIYHEVGSSRITAQPMIRPAIDAEGPKLAARVRAHLGSLH